MPYHFRNLVFEGGGVKGIAYVGAMESLGRRRILSDIERVGGTSAGAINAALFALGYSNPQVRDLLANLDFTDFLDKDWGVVRNAQRLLNDFGWYRGDAFHDWMGQLVRRKLGRPDATFADLKAAGRPDLYVYGTHLNTRLSVVYSHEHTPAIAIADAVRISMSIPLYFAAMRATRNKQPGVYVDGGLLNNYPVKLFDRLRYIERCDRKACVRDTDYYARLNRDAAKQQGRRLRNRYVYNRQTLGLRLDTTEEINLYADGKLPAGEPIEDFFDFSRALMGTLMEAQSAQHLHSDDWQRTVYIDVGDVGTTEFDLSDARKRKLIAAGRQGVRRYFDWFNDPASEPVNAT